MNKNKKSTRNPLVIARNTVRTLASKDLELAAGGGKRQTYESCDEGCGPGGGGY